MSYQSIYTTETPYQTLGESIFHNGNRHVRRGLEHYAGGRPEYAKGSFAKALRNYERALEVSAVFCSQDLVRIRAGLLLQEQVKRLKDEANAERI